MENEQEIYELLNQAFQAKVFTDVQRAFQRMDDDVQREMMTAFDVIIETHGENSKEMHDYFHSQCMKFSKLYYFVNTTGADENNWDEALQKELLS